MQMLITCKKSTIMGSSRDRIWPSDEKRQDLKVNNHNTHDFVCFLILLFACYCKFPSFRRHSPKCPVDRQPLSRDKVTITHNFLLVGHANQRFHVLLSENRSFGILTHNSKRSFLQMDGPYCKMKSKQNMSGIRVENILALSFVTNAEICFN